MAVTVKADDRRRYSAEIAASLYGQFRTVADLETLSELIDLELRRYAAVPVKDFVVLLVEREVRARLRDLEAREATAPTGGAVT